MLEELLFNASELFSLARWRRREQSVGLEESVAAEMLAGAERALLAAEFALAACSSATASFRNFFLWLQLYMRRHVTQCWRCALV